MNDSFAGIVQQAIIDACRRELGRPVAWTPYGFALIGGQCANYLGYAVATEEGLKRVADEYHARGWKYEAFEWEKFDNREKLAIYLRWANPDDGWRYENFAERFEIQTRLERWTAADGVDKTEAKFEEFCTDVLASLQTTPEWRELVLESNLIVGFTWGEDPRDFLRTATRANPYPKVLTLWDECWQADELRSRITSPSDRKRRGDK
jgi:hypothetical protein